MIITDFDDQRPNHTESCLDWLIELKHKYPFFKTTLFVIPELWNMKILSQINDGFYSWIQFGLHGYSHETNDECEHWDKEEWNDILSEYENGTFVKLFKAPNWQMSRLGYEVLMSRGWAVAVLESQIKDLPKDMKYYSFEEQGGIHGHTWLMKDHIEKGWFKKVQKNSDFGFIIDNLKTK